jgi:beta-lactam-binding protein with PASTA domain
MTGGKHEVVVPDLLGLTLEEAQEQIKGMDLTIVEPVLTQSDEETEAGKIIHQNPGANKSVKKNTEIVLTISTGAEVKSGDIKVPDLTSLTYSVALESLKNRNLKAVKIDEESDDVKEGLVIRQNPEKDAMVSEDTVVTVYVSSGSKTKVDVPSLKGMTKEKAAEELKAYGLEIGKTTKEESSEAEGTVIRQTPSEGSKVSKGSSVSIVISSGGTSATATPEATQKAQDDAMYLHDTTQKPQLVNTTTPIKTEPPTENKQAAATTAPTTESKGDSQEAQVKTLTVSFPDTVGETVQVRIEANGREIYNKTHNKSEGGTQVQVKGTKDTEVKIYFDGNLVSTKTISFD